MINCYTYDNLIELMQHLGTVRYDQLFTFFRNDINHDALEELIRDCIVYHILELSNDKQWLSYHAAPKRKSEFVRRDSYAFWCIADIGSDKINSVTRLAYPSQFMFITTAEEDEDGERICDELVYDLTVCSSEAEAALAQRIREMNTLKGTPDTVNHVAVLYSKDMIDIVKPYGFDSWCVIDRQTHIPEYGVFDDE